MSQKKHQTSHLKRIKNDRSIAMWMTIIVLVLTSIGTAIGIYVQSLHPYDIIACITGTLALAYTTYCLSFIFTDKIRRDVMLVKKNYLIWVILMIVVMPFIFARYALLTGFPNEYMLGDSNYTEL